jgi:putative phosphoesterase
VKKIKMKIGVISDTHMPKRGKELPKTLVQGLKDVDLIIHAGDWQTLDVYDELRKIAAVEGVAGNVDGNDIVERFGYKKVLSFDRFTIGVVHGHGTSKTTEKRVLESFKDDHVDLIIFGHSHIPIYKSCDGVWLFNPGSPMDKRRQKQFSFGILTLDSEIKGKHIYYDDKA